MIFTKGVTGTLMKAKNETENETQTVQLKKKQKISKLARKTINKTTREWQFID